MDKANQALRRGSIRLRSLNSGHVDLNLIISDLKEMRSAYKKFCLAQKCTWDDMGVWASKEGNMALQEAFHHLSEISDLWYEVQREFAGSIKKLQHQFQVVLESEHTLDKSRVFLTSNEQKEAKLQKELLKLDSSVRAETRKDQAQVVDRLKRVSEVIQTGRQEVLEKTEENEALKLMKVKMGLLEFSDECLDFADKTTIVLGAHKQVVQGLPNPQHGDMQNMRYTGSEVSRRAVTKAKQDLHHYKQNMGRSSAPPPPYTTSPEPSHNTFVFNSPSSPGLSDSSFQGHRYCEIPETTSPRDRPPIYDLPPRENYENIGAAADSNQQSSS